MVEFPTYSDEECAQLARDYLRFEAGLVGVDLDLGTGSDADMTARLLGALLAMSQRQATAVMTAASPIKSFGAFLRQHATDYGIGPSLDRVGVDAIAAQGFAIIVCTAGSASVPAGLSLRAPDGQEYITTDSATAPSAAGGNALIGWLYGSSRRRFILGSGDGTLTTTFTPAIGEVLSAYPSGELCAVSEAVGAGTGAQQERFELYNELDELPQRFQRALAVSVPITAANPGRAGNRDPKAALTVLSPPAGVSSSAYVLYCNGGRDAMTAGEMRTALRDLFSTRQTQASNADLRRLAIATPRVDIEDCVVMPGYFGLGSYFLRPLGRFGRNVSSSRAIAVEFYARSHGPRGLNIRASGLTELSANVTTVDVDCAHGYGPDFQITQPNGYHLATVKSVAGMASTSVLISDVTDATTIPRVGDRVVVSSRASAVTPIDIKRAFIVHAKVTSVFNAAPGTWLIEIDKPICRYNAPAALTAGGPLGDAVIDALLASYDTRLPSVPTAAPFVTFPDLESSTNQGALSAALARVPGVVDVQVSADEAYTMTGSQVWSLGPIVLRMHAG